MRKAILLPAIFLTACSNYPASLPSFKPYQMDIQQGNVVTSKMMLQLRPGMTKAQVRFVMGTPLIADSFHANRWDYLYRMQKSGKVIEQRRVILDFEDDKLKGVRGDVVPAGSGPSDKPASKEPFTLKPANGAAPKKEEKGMLDKLKFWKDDDEKTPSKPAQPATEEKLQALPPLMENPATTPEAAPLKEAKPDPKSAPAPKQEEKGMLDKLKFWKSDEPKGTQKPATKAAPAPQPSTTQLPAIADEKPEPLPPLMDTPAAEPKPTPAKPESKPAARQEHKAESKPQPNTEQKPVVKPAPKAESKPAPKPQADLPSEDDPSYFERMLEKIGF